MIEREAANARRAWLLAWLGGPVIGIANGLLREASYARKLGEGTAHQLSSVTAIAAFAAYFRALHHRWPIATDREAAEVGAAWLALTMGFELAFGRAVAKQSWQELVADYNVARGRMWPLVLAWIAIGPMVTRRLAGRLTSGAGARIGGAPHAS
jgi:hypothetical protein